MARRRLSLRDGILLTGIPLAFLLLQTHADVGGWNDGSRLAAVESLVERGTWVIDESPFRETGDKVWIPDDPDAEPPWFVPEGDGFRARVPGHYYSDKPPLLSLWVAGPALLVKWAGLSLGDRDSYERAVWWTCLLSMGPFALALPWTMREVARALGHGRPRAAWIGLFSLAGTLCLTWSVTINSHLPTAVLLAGSALALLRARGAVGIAVAGGLAGLAAAIGVAAGTAWCAAVALRLARRSGWREVAIFSLATLPALAIHAALNVPVAHTLRPGSAVREYWRHPTSQFFDEDVNVYEVAGQPVRDALLGSWHHESIGAWLLYGADMLVGRRGWLLYTPMLWLSVAALTLTARAPPADDLRDAVLPTIGLVFAFYWCLSVSHGGWAFGSRYLVDVTPLALLPWIAAAVRRPGLLGSAPAAALIAASVAIAWLGSEFPWTPLIGSSFPLREAWTRLWAAPPA